MTCYPMLALRDLQENCKKIVTFRDFSATCNFFTYGSHLLHAGLILLDEKSYFESCVVGPPLESPPFSGGNRGRK